MGTDDTGMKGIADDANVMAETILASGDREGETHTLRLGPARLDALEVSMGDLWAAAMAQEDPTARQMLWQKLDGMVHALSLLGLRVGFCDVPGDLSAGTIRIDLPGNRPGEMTVSEAAAALGVSRGRVRQLVNPSEGVPGLSAHKSGGVWVIDEASVRDYAARRRPRRPLESA